MAERFLAFVDKTDTTFLPEFARHDAYMRRFTLAHAEGDFASLTVEIERPAVALLSPARKQWVWLSEQRGSVLTPLFFGHIVGIPADLQDEFYTVEFMARPAAYQATKRALAETLKVEPFWDYAYIDPQRYRDPDAVLEARTDAWHIDPVTHAVTISSLLAGEDGTLEVAASDCPADGLRLTYSQAPLKRVDLVMRAMWTQVLRKTVNLKPAINDAFAAAGSPDGRVTSYTGEGLLRDWPQEGDPLGSGWRFGRQKIKVVDGVTTAKQFKIVPVRNDVPPAESGAADNPFNPVINPFAPQGVDGYSIGPGTGSGDYSLSLPGWYQDPFQDLWAERQQWLDGIFGAGGGGITVHSGGPYTLTYGSGDNFIGSPVTSGSGSGGTSGDGVARDPTGAGGQTANTFYYRNWQMRVDRSEAVTDAEIDRTEDIYYSVVSDVQAVSADPDDEASETLTLSSGLIGTRIRLGSVVDYPIGAPGADVYFPTERGLASIEFGLALARAKIMRRARAAEVEVKVPYDLAAAASLRMSATVTHPRLPGGSATGKITGISFGINGDTGAEEGLIRISCLVGLASNLTANPGDPVFVDDDYVEEDYQERDGEERSILGGEIVYATPVTPEPDLVTPAVDTVTVTNGEAVQEEALNGYFEDANEASDALNAVATSVEIRMTEIDDAPRFTVYEGGTVELAVPMGIDLGEG